MPNRCTMLGSHCRAIRYEHHDWPFVADRGICSGGGAALPFPFLPLVPLVAFLKGSKITKCALNEARSILFGIYVGARTRNRSWASMKSRDYSYLLASKVLYQLISSRESFMSGREQWYPTEGHRSWEIATHPNRAWCWSCPRLIPITTI